MKYGLVMEGGAMRGMFTCGVMDVFLENDINFDGAAGVSAGAAFGCNIKSRQKERGFRYNTLYSHDKRYMGLHSFLTTGDLFNADFCYKQIPDTLDVFDRKTFKENPMEFYVVATNALTGEAVYHKCYDAGEEDVLWIRASASMPLVSRPVDVNGMKFLDGGIADSIPLEFMEKMGYEKNVVILTRPRSYVKKQDKLNDALVSINLKQYPEAVKAMKNRYLMYNDELNFIRKREGEGKALVIAPCADMNISRAEKDTEELERAYRFGKVTAERMLNEVKEFLNGSEK